jgi:hypothetical protein
MAKNPDAAFLEKVECTFGKRSATIYLYRDAEQREAHTEALLYFSADFVLVGSTWVAESHGGEELLERIRSVLGGEVAKPGALPTPSEETTRDDEAEDL